MTQDDRNASEEARGVALAAYLVSVNVMRTLHQSGLLPTEGVHALLTGCLRSLESIPEASKPEIAAARQLLSGLAAELGVPMSKPN